MCRSITLYWACGCKLARQLDRCRASHHMYACRVEEERKELRQKCESHRRTYQDLRMEDIPVYTGLSEEELEKEMSPEEIQDAKTIENQNAPAEAARIADLQAQAQARDRIIQSLSVFAAAIRDAEVKDEDAEFQPPAKRARRQSPREESPGEESPEEESPGEESSSGEERAADMDAARRNRWPNINVEEVRNRVRRHFLIKRHKSLREPSNMHL